MFLGKINEVYDSFDILISKRELSGKITVAKLSKLVYFKMFNESDNLAFSEDNPGLSMSELSQLATSIVEAESILTRYGLSRASSKRYLKKLQYMESENI